VTLPLADVRMLAVEQFGAGPWATMRLVDLGAEVIKIEDPASGGDVSRYVPPFQEGEDSLYFETFNRNKKSISLAMRHPRARRVFEDLVRGSDAVFSNLRGGQPERLGLTYARLKEANPSIVCCSPLRVRHHWPSRGGPEILEGDDRRMPRVRPARRAVPFRGRPGA
jgi:crotonobetainyl-CoA:carnitine CoA-transferase CaiB-like acyl-CoA transferase